MKRGPIRLAAGASVLIASIAFAHVYLVTRGVHFKDIPTDFGAPPARYGMYYYANNYVGPGTEITWRAGTSYVQDPDRQDDDDMVRDGNGQLFSRSFLREQNLTRRAEKLERLGQYRDARTDWKQLIGEGFDRFGAVGRRVALIEQILNGKHVLGGRELLSQISANGNTRLTIQDSELDPLLVPFARYARADNDRVTSRAGKEFLAFANDYPHSFLAEPALIMAARTLLREGVKQTEADCATAQTALDDLARRFPHSRFTADAIGWQGRIAYLKKDYTKALNLYWKQYRASPPEDALILPLQSVILCEQRMGVKAAMVEGYLLRYGLATDISRKMTANRKAEALFEGFDAWDGKMLWSKLRSDPQLLCFYMDYRLESTAKVGDVVELARLNGQGILKSKYRAQFASRVAEAAFRNYDYAIAVRYARMALESNPPGEAGSRARYLLGSIARRTGKTDHAIRHYEAILSEYPKSYLVKPARECLALLYEGQSRMGDALDIYRELEYPEDVAYLLDIRMSPKQIGAYLSSHPRLKVASRERIVYTLGLRYMREHHWSDAERAFSELSRKRRIAFAKFDADDFNFDRANQQDPLVSTRELARFDQAASAASGPNRKAKALLAMAQYYDKHRNLMLYNAPMWDGKRALTIQSWNDKASTASDRSALERHHWDHEALAQCLLTCKRLLKECPKSPLRYQAAYLAATSADHLTNFNSYWRWLNAKGDLELDSVHWMKLAAGSAHPALAKKARKFLGVFTEEWYGQRQELKEFKHSPRWLGDWRE